MYEVEIEATDIGFDFNGAVVAPMALLISDAVTVWARITPVIPMRRKLRIV